MTTTTSTLIRTIDGRALRLGHGERYVKAGTCGSKYVYTDVVRSDGTRLAGPTVTVGVWRNIDKAQHLIDRWLEADSKATGCYKASRYWIVNGYDGAGRPVSQSRIDREIDRMTAWETKREAAWAGLYDLGVTAF